VKEERKATAVRMRLIITKIAYPAPGKEILREIGKRLRIDARGTGKAYSPSGAEEGNFSLDTVMERRRFLGGQ